MVLLGFFPRVSRVCLRVSRVFPRFYSGFP